MIAFDEYILEKEGKETVTSDDGFAIFNCNGEEIYLEIMFVKKDRRKQGSGSKLADQVAAIGKDRGAKYFTTSVNIFINESAESLKAVLAYGFRPIKTTNNGIVLMKELT